MTNAVANANWLYLFDLPTKNAGKTKNKAWHELSNNHGMLPT
jgi:hypothetical protein